MTDQANLERAYRRLLVCYPRAFRQEKEEEILTVLMACSLEGQRRPSLAASMDLITSGLWMRVQPCVPRSVGARSGRRSGSCMWALPLPPSA